MCCTAVYCTVVCWNYCNIYTMFLKHCVKFVVIKHVYTNNQSCSYMCMSYKSNKEITLKILDARPGFIIKFLKRSLIVNFI